MKARQHFALVAATVLSSLAGLDAAAQKDTAPYAPSHPLPSHPLIDSLEQALDIRMESEDGFAFSHQSDAKTHVTLKIVFEDTDRNGRLSAADQVSYAETTDQDLQRLSWMERLEEETYRRLYKNNALMENERYLYVTGVVTSKKVADALVAAGIAPGYIEDFVRDADEADGKDNFVFIPEGKETGKSPAPLVNKIAQSYKMNL